jgi:hypothetical protein
LIIYQSYYFIHQLHLYILYLFIISHSTNISSHNSLSYYSTTLHSLSPSLSQNPSYFEILYLFSLSILLSSSISSYLLSTIISMIISSILLDYLLLIMNDISYSYSTIIYSLSMSARPYPTHPLSIIYPSHHYSYC